MFSLSDDRRLKLEFGDNLEIFFFFSQCGYSQSGHPVRLISAFISAIEQPKSPE